ncbi:MAG: hypothetical protein IPG69_21330 [Flavobacteriales bacterium]|nr:hypothetical protein [Flavobacteriales bacterium]
MSIHVDLAMLYVLNERLPLARLSRQAEGFGCDCSDLLNSPERPPITRRQQEDSVRLLRSLVNSGEVGGG